MKDNQFSRSGRSALHVLCPTRQAPAAALTIDTDRAPPPTPPPVDCCGPMPILDHVIRGRATANFPDVEGRPNTYSIRPAKRSWPPSTSTMTTRRPPRHHRWIAAGLRRSSAISFAAAQRPIFQMWKIGPVLAAVTHAAHPQPPSTSPAHLRPRQRPRGRTRHHRLIVADNRMAVAPTSRSAQHRERGQTRKTGESPAREAFADPQRPHG